MNEIALGNESAWLVLSGPSPDPPFKAARLSPVHAASGRIADRLTVSMSGTPAEIAAGLALLEAIKNQAEQYEKLTYPHRQLIRIQPEESSEYFYAPVTDLWLELPPEGETRHQHGSLIVTVHFTRPNYFDGEQIELPLTVGDLMNQTGGVDIINHADIHPGHTNSILVNPGSVEGALPAPLRLEITNTYTGEYLKDIFVGIISHPDPGDEDMLHCYAPDFSGGYPYTNPSAIQGYYLKVTWPETTWKPLCASLLPSAQVASLQGRYFRPVLHLYNPVNVQDLRLKIALQSRDLIHSESEAVWVDPDYGYVVFPPIQIPPYPLFYEVSTETIDITLYGQHESGASYDLYFDDLILLPLDSAATYQGHHFLLQGSVLIDDNFKQRQITRFGADFYEINTHLKQGGDLLLMPGQYNRLLLIMTDTQNQVDILRTASVRMFYRKRVRFL